MTTDNGIAEIDRLRAENMRLREALRPFAAMADGVVTYIEAYLQRGNLSVDEADFARAAAVLGASPQQYRPVVIDFPDRGESEFVLVDCVTIARECGGYTLLVDVAGRPVGFRWPTDAPPSAAEPSP